MAKPAKQQPRPRRRVGLKLLAVFVLMAAVGSAGLYLVLGRQIDQRFGSRPLTSR